MNNKMMVIWRPVFLEPILDSGEKLCVAVCYKTENNIFYEKTIKNKISQLAYDNHKDSMENIIEYSCEYACELISRNYHSDVDTEILPGVYLGTQEKAEGFNIEEIHSRITKKVSFFGNIKLPIKAKKIKSSSYESLSKLLQEDLIRKKSPLISNFNKEKLIFGIPKKFDYIDEKSNFVANFIQLRIGRKFTKAEISCLELSMLEDSYTEKCLITTLHEDFQRKHKEAETHEIKNVAKHLGTNLLIMRDREEIADYLEYKAA